MENNYIQFRKIREFGDVFNDTFAFLKQEAKPLSMALLIFALPLLLISSIGLAYAQSQQISNVIDMSSFDMAAYFSKLGLILIFSMLGQMMLMVTVYSYCKLYLEKGHGNFDNNELFGIILKSFLPCLGAAIILGITIFIGLMMCGLPGIYLGVSLSFVIPIMILENQGFGMAFSRSFNLTHKQWWWTFLIIFVYVILAYVFTIIISLPGIIFGISTMFKLGSATDINIDYPGYLIIYSAFINLISTFITVILHIAIVLQYFNIVELFEGKTLSMKIDQISPNDQV